MPQAVGGPGPAARPGRRGEPVARGAGLAGRLRWALATGLDLPSDLVFDLPRVTLLGALHLTVENHRGLLECLPERVAIGTRGGRLVVVGRGLVVGAVRQGEITVSGQLTEVRFEGA